MNNAVKQPTPGKELGATDELRSYNPDNRLLRVYRRAPPSAQASQIALLEHREQMDNIIENAKESIACSGHCHR